ncbi:hypothetical protein HPB48_018795 [Haemaphysalis longicornis]|uniref:Mutator-like transposase domain-containing protein n=1 Tax=Haemaphysalis longicornis TaxID=44386 RepID=A0A9J6GQ25_HAELO|nr:hypothetical protein HPB48_018795 [Haemaphysalis longicornis]
MDIFTSVAEAALAGPSTSDPSAPVLDNTPPTTPDDSGGAENDSPGSSLAGSPRREGDAYHAIDGESTMSADSENSRGSADGAGRFKAGGEDDSSSSRTTDSASSAERHKASPVKRPAKHDEEALLMHGKRARKAARKALLSAVDSKGKAHRITGRSPRELKTLSSTSATERKSNLFTSADNTPPGPPDESSFVIASLDCVNVLLSAVKCSVSGDSVTFRTGERAYGLSVKMVIACATCGDVASEWSSPRVNSDKKVNPFIVNILAARAMQATGNGQTAVNDVFATMNISHRGLHTKTWQGYVKEKLAPAATRAADNVMAENAHSGSASERLGGKGRLTGDLVTKLSSYYGWALKSHGGDVRAMHKAVMATYHHITSNDTVSNHSLCPPGPDSCCRQNTAKAKGEPTPKHRYNLPPHVCEALLPVYERLSDKKLLQRCLQGKTQNSNESLHSMIWALAPKEKHASLFTVQAAVAEAVLKFNAGNERASASILKQLDLNPGLASTKRMAEKDRRRGSASARKHKSADSMQRAFKKRHSGASSQTDYVPDDSLDAEKRIAVLQDRLTELRKVYMQLKAEVAVIDRRRKRAKKKETGTPVLPGASATPTHSQPTCSPPSSPQQPVEVECSS